jgi:photosystem II stability/assembly factor-like uncharacterized protein
MRINIGFEFTLTLIITLAMTISTILRSEAWNPFSLEGQGVLEMVINPQNPENMYVIPGFENWGHDLLKTTDDGRTWCSVLGEIRHPSCIAIDPIEPGNIYVGAQKVVGHNRFGEITNGAVFKSTNGGETWDKGFEFHDPPVSILQIVVHPADSNVLYVARSRLNSALHRSKDGGKSWVMCSRLVNEVGSLFIDVDQSNPDVVYACGTACWFFAVGKSEDGGMNFTRLNLPGDPKSADSLAVAPNRPDTLYVMSYRSELTNRQPSVFRSTDGGLTWRVFPTGLKSEFKRLKVNPANPNFLCGTTAAGELFVSEDGGESWSLFMDGMEGVKVSNLIFHPKHPWILYASTSNGIYRMEHRIRQVGVSPDGMRMATWGYIRSAP